MESSSSNSLRSQGLIVKGNPYCTWIVGGSLVIGMQLEIPLWGLVRSTGRRHVASPAPFQPPSGALYLLLPQLLLFRLLDVLGLYNQGVST